MAEIMIENIIQTENGYRATVDGVELSIPDAPGNRHWQMVQDAIADAPPAPVTAPGEKLEWDGAQWSVREPSEAEVAIQWASVRAHRNELLTESDVFVVRAYENGEPVPQDTIDYRQALRDVTKQANPFAIAWPVPPTNPF